MFEERTPEGVVPALELRRFPLQFTGAVILRRFEDITWRGFLNQPVRMQVDHFVKSLEWAVAQELDRRLAEGVQQL